MIRLSRLTVILALFLGGCSHGLSGVADSVSRWAGAAPRENSNDRYREDLLSDGACLDMMRERLAREFYGRYPPREVTSRSNPVECRMHPRQRPTSGALTVEGTGTFTLSRDGAVTFVRDLADHPDISVQVGGDERFTVALAAGENITLRVEGPNDIILTPEGHPEHAVTLDENDSLTLTRIRGERIRMSRSGTEGGLPLSRTASHSVTLTPTFAEIIPNPRPGSDPRADQIADLALRYWNGRRAQIDIRCGIVFSDLTDLKRGSRFVRNSTNMAVDSIIALSSIAGVGSDFVPVVSVSQIGFNNLHAEVEALVMITPDLAQLLAVVRQRQEAFVAETALPFAQGASTFTIDQFPTLERIIFEYQQFCMPGGLQAAMSESLRATVERQDPSSSTNIGVRGRRIYLDRLFTDLWTANAPDPSTDTPAPLEPTPLTDAALYRLVWLFQLAGTNGYPRDSEISEIQAWLSENNLGVQQILKRELGPRLEGGSEPDALAPVRSALTNLVEAVPSVLERAQAQQEEFRRQNPAEPVRMVNGEFVFANDNARIGFYTAQLLALRPQIAVRDLEGEEKTIPACDAAFNTVRDTVATGGLPSPNSDRAAAEDQMRTALEIATRENCAPPVQ